MKTVEIKVFKFSELSDSAKLAAFEKWHDEKAQWQYAWLAEFEEVLNLIEEKSGFKVKNWKFDEYNYNFELDAPDVDCSDLPDWFEFWEKIESARNAKNTHGKRAIKEVLRLYYDLTITEIGYNKHYDSYYQTELKKAQKRLPNTYAMPIKNECFSGVWLSQIFSDSLLNNSKLIIKNGLSFFDAVELAISDMFNDVVQDWAWSLSFEYFEEHCANEVEYLSNGDVFE